MEPTKNNQQFQTQLFSSPLKFLIFEWKNSYKTYWGISLYRETQICQVGWLF